MYVFLLSQFSTPRILVWYLMVHGWSVSFRVIGCGIEIMRWRVRRWPCNKLLRVVFLYSKNYRKFW